MGYFQSSYLFFPLLFQSTNIHKALLTCAAHLEIEEPRDLSVCQETQI